MASSFLIAYPDVPASSLVYTPSSAFDTDYPLESTFYGERNNYGVLASTASTLTLTYDLGTGNSRTLDHFILGGAYELYLNGVTAAYVQGSNDGSSWTSQLGTTSNFLTRAFAGPYMKDLAFTAGYNDEFAATLAAYRYFRLTLGATNACKFPVSKLYFGTFLDMGKEPDYFEVSLVEDDVDTWWYVRGQIMMTKSTAAHHKITVEWDGVSDVNAKLFSTKLLGNPYKKHVFLYTATALDPLFSKRVMHAKVLPDECSDEQTQKDWHLIKASFLEMV